MTDTPDDRAPAGDLDDDALDRFDPAAGPAPPDEAAAQAPYRRLVGRLQQLAPLTPPAGWEARAEARLRAARSAERRRRALAAGAVALAAAAAVFLLLRGSPRAKARPLAVAIAATDGEVRRGPAAQGDRLRASVTPPGGHVELRVYLGTRLVGRCPSPDGTTTCRQGGRAVELDLELREPGLYRVYSLTGPRPLPAPTDGGLELDLLRVRQDGGDIAAWEPVPIR